MRDDRAACEGERASLADRAAALRDGETRSTRAAAGWTPPPRRWSPGWRRRGRPWPTWRSAFRGAGPRPRLLEVAEVADPAAVLLQEAGGALAERLAELAEAADRRLLEVELEAAADHWRPSRRSTTMGSCRRARTSPRSGRSWTPAG